MLLFLEFELCFKNKIKNLLNMMVSKKLTLLSIKYSVKRLFLVLTKLLLDDKIIKPFRRPFKYKKNTYFL